MSTRTGSIGLGLRSDGGTPPAGTAPGPLGAPLELDDDQPLTFAAPPGLDDKGARDWRKIAEKVAEREFAPALGKLREFERRHGATDETARLRAWLERQP